MHLLIAAILVLLVAAIYKYWINAVYASRIRAYRLEYEEHVVALIKNKATWDFVKKCPAIKELIKRANIDDQTLSRVEPVGYNYVQNQRFSVFDNISANDKEIRSHVIKAFYEAEGVFETRKREARDLYYWTEVIIYLPSKILSYLGFSNELLGRIANVIGWCAEFLTVADGLNKFWVQYGQVLKGVF
ncbi:MAG: hypothetical protein WC521_06465 [Bdellovibrionales bacterium]